MSDVENGDSISSDIFSLNGNTNAKFVVKLEYSQENYCNICLDFADFGRSQTMELDVEVWRSSSKGLVGDVTRTKLVLNKAITTRFCTGMYNIAQMKSWAHAETTNEIDFENDNDESIVHTEFSPNMFELHSDGHFDLTIQAENKEFKVSKYMLMACSEVFRRMLSYESAIESMTGTVKIEDFNPQVINAMIRWIYQVEVDNLDELAMDLYKAADKYDIRPLKKVCLKVMAKGVLKENVTTCLILAHRFNEEKLKQHIFDFLCEDIKNMQSLIMSVQWMKFGGEYTEDAVKILEEIYNKPSL